MLADSQDMERGRILLRLARDAIEITLGNPVLEGEKPAWLQQAGATFVTLTQQNELRGCIGTLEAHRPILQDVQSNAVAAAFRDPRFAPLRSYELDKTRVEVSLLSEMQPLQFAVERDALHQLLPGVHGVVFEYGRYRSTFLPQVWEQLPSVREFMAHLKQKAGLPPDFWAEGVRLSTYTVAKWKEDDDSKKVAA